MYLERIVALLTNFYHTYPLYVIAILVVILMLFFFKTKAMSKLSLFLLVLVLIIYIAGLFMEGVSNSSEQKKTMTEKSKQYDK
ncbi:MAG: hypothetical protein IBX47_12240 [Desulfuromonadales bacterium]|nr:hypothetical protein [Desulfuromonadales bacterium]